MVLGLGTDAIEIDRIERSIARFGDRFLKRVFTAGEIAYCQARRSAAESFAARFAAKEAAAKALGTGIARGVSWQDIEVVRRPGQAPNLRWHGAAVRRVERLGITASSLSLTHSRNLALAVVIVEGPVR